jgi:hypothetical protein
VILAAEHVETGMTTQATGTVVVVFAGVSAGIMLWQLYWARQEAETVKQKHQRQLARRRKKDEYYAAAKANACHALPIGLSPPLEWYVVTDTCMGGISTATLEADHEGSLLFSGITRLAGGGFASIRSTVAAPFGCSVTDSAVVVSVTGDGQTYTLMLRDDDTPDCGTNIHWQSQFPTTAGQRATHVLPLALFEGSSGGKRINGPKPDWSTVSGAGITVSVIRNRFGNTEGPFSLRIHAIAFTQTAVAN